MLVGYAGVGKTVFVGDMLASLSEDYVVSRVPFNYHTTSAALQSKCSSCLHSGDKRSEMVRAVTGNPERWWLSFSRLQTFSQASEEFFLITILGKSTLFRYCDVGFSDHSWLCWGYYSEDSIPSVMFIALPLNCWVSFSQFMGPDHSEGVYPRSNALVTFSSKRLIQEKNLSNCVDEMTGHELLIKSQENYKKKFKLLNTCVNVIKRTTQIWGVLSWKGKQRLGSRGEVV